MSAISIDRYYAIVHPLRSRAMLTVRRAKRLVVIVWILSITVASPGLRVKSTIHPIEKQPDHTICGYVISETMKKVYILYSFLAFFGTPFLIVSCTYMFIIKELRLREQVTAELNRVPKIREHACMPPKNDMKTCKGKARLECAVPILSDSSTSQLGIHGINIKTNVIHLQAPKLAHQSTSLEGSDSVSSDKTSSGAKPKANKTRASYKRKNKSVTERKKETRQIIRMLLVILALYSLCWGPFFFLRLLIHFEVLIENNPFVFISTHIFTMATFLNSVMNPFVYTFMSKKFSQCCSRTLRNTFCFCFKRKISSRQILSHYASSPCATRKSEVIYSPYTPPRIQESSRITMADLRPVTPISL